MVIEDLISTGGSSLKAVEALEEAGAEVVGIAAIFTYGLAKGKQLLEESGTKLVTLTNYDELIEVALNENYVTGEDMETLKEWKKNPENWGK